MDDNNNEAGKVVDIDRLEQLMNEELVDEVDDVPDAVHISTPLTKITEEYVRQNVMPIVPVNNQEDEYYEYDQSGWAPDGVPEISDRSSLGEDFFAIMKAIVIGVLSFMVVVTILTMAAMTLFYAGLQFYEWLFSVYL